MSSRLEIAEVKTRKKKKTKEKLVKGKQPRIYFCWFLLASLSKQGAGDVNVCPGIKRPLIVCFRL